MIAITTSDNPYDPLDDFSKWHAWDTAHGYNTAAYLDRVMFTSDDLSEADQEIQLERAIDEIVSFNLTGNYVKIVRNDENE